MRSAQPANAGLHMLRGLARVTTELARGHWRARNIFTAQVVIEKYRGDRGILHDCTDDLFANVEAILKDIEDSER